VITTLYDVPSSGPSVGAFIDSNKHEYYVGTTSSATGTYNSNDDKLSSNGINLNSSEKAVLGGIYTNDRVLKFDFGTQNVTVENTKNDSTSSLTWGFGYVLNASDSYFSGTLNATSASSSSLSVTAASGHAFGLVFKSAMNQNAGFAELSGAKISLSGVTIKVKNSGTNGDAYGFAAGNLVGDTTIKLGDIESVLGGQGNNVRGFVAGDINLNETASIAIKNVTAKSDSTGKSKSVVAVELKEIKGDVTVSDTITATGQGTNTSDSAIGFSAQNISLATSKVTLKTVNVAENVYGNATGVTIDKIDEGQFSVSEGITVTAANNATGFKINNISDKSSSNLTLNSIKATANSGDAIGFSLTGSAAADKIKLNNNITVEAKNGGSAIGISAGRLEAIDISKVISATTDATQAYGILTGNSGSSVINIKDGASIYTTTSGTPSANTAGIKMDSTGIDVVNIEAGPSGGSEWKNADGTAKAFTLSGVETLNVTGYVDLSGTDSLRGRASAPNGVALTDVSGALKVKDSFFKTGTGTSSLKVTGKLEIIKGSDDATKVVTFNEFNGDKDTAEVNLANTNNTLSVSSGNFAGKITGAGTLKRTGNNGTLTLTNATPFATDNKVDIDGGTLKLDRSAHDDSSGYTFNQALTGSGTLDVALKDTDYKFLLGSTVGTAFTGTVSLTKGTIELNVSSSDTVKSLEKATLKLAADSVVDVKQNNTIGGLTTSGGTVKFTATEISPETILTVGTLNVTGGVTIDLSGITSTITTSTLNNQSLFDYAQSQQLIAATTVSGTGNVTLKPDDDTLKTRTINNGTDNVGTATFDYTGSVKNTTTQKGVYLDYLLKEIAAADTKTVTLDASKSNSAAPRLNAKLTQKAEEVGNFEFTGKANQNVQIGNDNSDYTGETEVDNVNFTVTAIADNAFGQTSKLTVGADATVDFGEYSQTVGELVGTGTIKLGNLTVNPATGVTTTFSGTLTNTSASDVTGSLTKIGDGTLKIESEVDLKTGTINVNVGTLEFDNSSAGEFAKVKNIVVNGNDAILDLKANSIVEFFENNTDNALTIKEGKARFDILSGLVQNGWVNTPSEFNIEIENGTIEFYNETNSSNSNKLNPHLAAVTTTVKASAVIDVGNGITFDPGVVKTDRSKADVTKKGTGTLRIQYGFDLDGGEIIVQEGILTIDPDEVAATASLNIDANVKLNANKFNIGDDNTAINSVMIGSLSGDNGSTTNIHKKDSLTITKTGDYSGQFQAITATSSDAATLIIGNGNDAAVVTLNHATPFTDNAGTGTKSEYLQVQIADKSTLKLDRATQSSDYEFNQKLLDGTGTLEVGLNDKDTKFSFGNDVGSEFTGTVSLTQGTIELNGSSNNNAESLKNATLQLTADSIANVAQNTTIGSLTANGGTVNFSSNNIILTVDDLDIRNKVTIKFPSTAAGADITLPISNPPSLFDYTAANRQRIIAAKGEVEGNESNITFDSSVSTSQSREIKESGTKVGTAKFNYNNPTLKKDGNATENGIYLSYGLTEIEAENGKTVTLDATHSDPASRGLYAKLTEDKLNSATGSFKFIGISGQNVEVGNDQSDYTGTTEVTGTSFTVTAATDNAFGKTSKLTVGANTTVDFDEYSQTVGGLDGNGKITNGDLTVNTGSGNSTFNGTLEETSSLTKKGNNKLTLSGNNSYTGATNINTGTLELTGAGSIKNSSGVTLAAGTTFEITDITDKTSIQALNGNGTVTLGSKELEVKKGSFSGTIIGTNGSLTKIDSETTIDNTLTLSGINDYSGETKINAGTLALTGTGSIASSEKVTVGTKATFDVSDVTTTASVKDLQSTADNAAVVLGTEGLSVAKGSFAGVISGTNGKLIKTGTDDLELSGENTYNGATIIQDGNLKLTGNGSIASSSGVTLTTGTTFDVTGITNKTSIQALNGIGTVALDTKEIEAGQGSFAGTITGTGTFTKNTGGTLTLTNDTPFTDASKIKISGGTLALDRSLKTESEYTFNQKLLAGTGTLDVTLGDKTNEFKLGNNVGNAFTGTVRLTQGTMILDGSSVTNYNVTSLEKATLQLTDESIADVQANSAIGGLTTNGGTVKFTTTEISPNAKLTVDKLDISNGVILDLSATITNGTIVTTPSLKQSFFDYADDDNNLQQQLIAATTVTNNNNQNNISLKPPAGNTEQIREINDGTNQVGTAKFGYTAALKTDGSGNENGVYLGYGLTQIEVFNDKTVTLDATGSTTNRLNAQLTGNGSFEFTAGDSNRSVEVGNSNSNYEGTTTVTTAVPGTNFTVNALSDNAFGNTSKLTVNNNATVDFQTYAQTVGGIEGNGKITNGDLTVDTDKGTGDSTFNGTLEGTSSLAKNGNDKLILSGTNTYTGETNINAGTLELTGTGSIARSEKVTVNSNATFDIQNLTSTSTSVRNLQSAAEDANVILGEKELSVEQGSFAGQISGNGTLTKTGTSSDTLTISGTNTSFIGKTNIKNGTLALTGNGSLAGSSNVNVDGTFKINGITNTTTHVQELTGNGNGKIDLGGKEIEADKGVFYGVISSNVNGRLTKTGSETLTLAGINTYEGATNINDGTLELTGNGSFDKTSGINVSNIATLNVQGNKTLNNLESAGSVTFNGSLALAGNNNTTVSGLAGDKEVTKTGTGTTILGTNTVGKFVQQKGNVVLGGTLTGDYQQQNTAGDFVAGTSNNNNVTISGNAQFDGNVTLKSRLHVDSLTLSNHSTLNVDFTQFTDPNDAIIKVDDFATINGNATFILKQYVPGEISESYNLLSAETVSGTFNDYHVIFDGQNADNRQGYKIEYQDNNILRLAVFTQNQEVTRSNGGQWSNSQWIGSDDSKFYNGDYVTLNGSGNQTMTVDSDIETAGMKITNGKWTFSGNTVAGKTQTVGADSLPPDNNKGALIVTGSNTAATFNNPINFSDISVTEKARLNLPGESPVKTGTLTVDKDAKLNLQAATNKVTATGDVVINGDLQLLYEVDPTQNKTIESIITTTGGSISGNFVSNISDKLLSSAKTQIVNQNRLDLVYTTSGAGGFAASSGLSGNSARIGNLIDTQNYADSKLLQELYELKSDEQEKFEQILLNQLGPELAANALQMNLWKPYLRIFNRLHENSNIYSYSYGNSVSNDHRDNIRGQNIAGTNYEFWLDSYYRDEKVSQDAFAGSYQSSRPGMLIGMESHLLHPFRAGMFFGYGKPRVFNEIGRVEAHDLLFGVYSRSQFGTQLFLNAFLAYGNQDYEYRHNGNRSSYGGEAIYASLELFHTTLRKDRSQLMPLFAVDFQKAWTDGFTTNDTAQKINKSEMDQIVLRFGMNSKFQPKEFLSFRTRLQYGVLIGGDTYGAIQTSYLSNPRESRTLTGVNLGRNMFNVGVGLNIYDSKFKHSQFFADYDFDLSERSTAHTGQIGIAIAW
jgi:autotransporter-associated beta strand protein